MTRLSATLASARISLVLLGAGYGANAQNTNTNSSFVRDVAPALQQHCVTCHNAEKVKGKYRLDSFERLLQPGTSGEQPIVAGKPDESPLLQLLVTKDADDRMPKDAEPLSEKVVSRIREWIVAGANYDGADKSAVLSTLIPIAATGSAPLAYRHSMPISALAFVQTNTLAIGAYYEVLLRTGTKTVRIPVAAERLHSMAINPAGNLLAIAGGSSGRQGIVQVIHLDQTNAVETITSAGDVFLTVTFSPDGRRIAFGGTSRAVEVVELATSAKLGRFEQHGDWVLDLAFSSDSSQLLCASRDRTARIYDIETGDLKNTFRAHEAPVHLVRFDEDRKRIFSIGADRKLRAWKKSDEKGKTLADFKDEAAGLLVFEDSIVVAFAKGQLSLRDSNSGKETNQIAERIPPILALAREGDSPRFATGHSDGTVRVWDLESAKLISEFTALPGTPEPTSSAKLR